MEYFAAVTDATIRFSVDYKVTLCLRAVPTVLQEVTISYNQDNFLILGFVQYDTLNAFGQMPP